MRVLSILLFLFAIQASAAAQNFDRHRIEILKIYAHLLGKYERRMIGCQFPTPDDSALMNFLDKHDNHGELGIFKEFRDGLGETNGNFIDDASCVAAARQAKRIHEEVTEALSEIQR